MTEQDKPIEPLEPPPQRMSDLTIARMRLRSTPTESLVSPSDCPVAAAIVSALPKMAPVFYQDISVLIAKRLVYTRDRDPASSLFRARALFDWSIRVAVKQLLHFRLEELWAMPTSYPMANEFNELKTALSELRCMPCLMKQKHMKQAISTRAEFVRRVADQARARHSSLSALASLHNHPIGEAADILRNSPLNRRRGAKPWSEKEQEARVSKVPMLVFIEAALVNQEALAYEKKHQRSNRLSSIWSSVSMLALELTNPFGDIDGPGVEVDMLTNEVTALSKDDEAIDATVEISMGMQQGKSILHMAIIADVRGVPVRYRNVTEAMIRGLDVYWSHTEQAQRDRL